MKQFSLNGRQFAVDDFIGNPKADSLIQHSPNLPDTVRVALDPRGARFRAYENKYWVNPGYYSEITGDAEKGYQYKPTTHKPTYKDVTGIPAVASVNKAKDKLPAHIPAALSHKRPRNGSSSTTQTSATHSTSTPALSSSPKWDN